MAEAFNRKATNVWTSRFIPVILVGIVGYATWVFVVLLCANYLLSPPATLHNHNPRHGAAVALLVLYAIFLLLMGLTYFCLIYTVTANPGYVPRGPHWHSKQEMVARAKRQHRKGRKVTHNPASPGKQRGDDGLDNRVDRRFVGGAYTEGAFDAPTTTEPAPGLEDFYNRDVFVCQGDGRPIWCPTCENWKPDRAHHCREIERCVRKMDHFCPWVGGVVSETSFKFFIQFVGWAAIYCVFNLVVMAYFLAEYRSKTHDLNVHWLAIMCLGALFGLFTMGMTGSSLQFAIINSTTIENLSRKTIVWTLAVYMPRVPQISPRFRTISFSSARGLPRSEANPNHDTSNAVRTFAILHTKPGENPFDLGPFRNFKSVMGDHWYDWFLPFRYSPCCNHDRQDSQFAMGPVVDRMRKEAGISSPSEINNEKPHRKRRRRRRHRSDDARADQSATEKSPGTNENLGFDAGHDMVEIDLESGHGRTDGSLR